VTVRSFAEDANANPRRHPEDLVSEVLEDPASLDPSMRRSAAANAGQVRREGEVVQASPRRSTAARVSRGGRRHRSRAQGRLSEDEVFELVVSSAVGRREEAPRRSDGSARRSVGAREDRQWRLAMMRLEKVRTGHRLKQKLLSR